MNRINTNLDDDKTSAVLASGREVNLWLPARDIKAGKAIGACAADGGSEGKKRKLHDEDQ